MTLPTGTIWMSQVNTELKRPATQAISLNDGQVRQLAGRPSGAIHMSQLRGKSWEIDRLLILAGYQALSNADKAWTPGIRGASENVGLRMSGTSYVSMGAFGKNTLAGRRIQSIYTVEPATMPTQPTGPPTLVLKMHGHIATHFFNTIEVVTHGIGSRGVWGIGAASITHTTTMVNSAGATIPITQYTWAIPTWDVIRANVHHDIILR